VSLASNANLRATRTCWPSRLAVHESPSPAPSNVLRVISPPLPKQNEALKKRVLVVVLVLVVV